MNSNIKRGYPNPNFTEEDIQEGTPLEMNAEILIDDKEYRELVAKAAALDILTARIKANGGKIEEEVVYAVTGTTKDQIKTEADKFEGWWHEECATNRKLKEENDRLKDKIDELEEKIDAMTPIEAEQQPDTESAEVSEDGAD